MSYIGYYLLGMLASARPGDGTEAVLSLAIHPIQNDIYVFALCKDHKIRMWLTSTNECVMVADVLCGQKQGQNQLLLGKLIKHKEAFSTLVESLVQMTCSDFTIFF